MSELDKTAIENLKLLNDLNDNLKECQLVIDGNKLTKSVDENYDTIINLRELEYPIYFTFNQLLNSIRYSNLYKIEGYSTKDLIRLMDNAIDCVVDMLENCDEDPNCDNFTNIIDNIDEKFIILKDRYTTCSIWRVVETFNDHLDSICEGFSECNRYLYFNNYVNLEKKEEFDDAVEGELNEETEEVDSNLIYDNNDNDNDKKED
jgi:hypothetical protein